MVLIGITVRGFVLIDRTTATLMLPYALWMCYTGYLVAGFLWLNPR
jgi:tryptophan-rich sensory protein